MSTVIPDGWVEINLGKIIELKYGKSLPAKTRDGVGAPVYGSNGVVGKHSIPLVSTPGIVVGRKGSFGEVTLASEPFSPIDTTYFVDEFCGQPLMYWFYQLKNLPLTSLNRSTAIPGLNREDAYEQVISLPPLVEQKVIADKLDELLAQVESTKVRLDAIPAILKSFRQSVLAAAVSGKLTEEWRGKEAKNWHSHVLKNLCTSISDGDHQAPPKAEKGVPFLVISNVNSGEVNFEKVSRWVPDTYYDSLKDIRKPQLNDILYTVTGSLGIPVIVKTNKPFCFQRHIAILKPDHSKVNFQYLELALKAPDTFEHATNVATGTAQKTISLTSLRNFNFPIPPPDEQTKIVRRVEELFAFADKVEAQVNEAQARVNNLTQSILAKAFKGELTAEWRAANPDLISGENSADALLKRIKAEREALITKKKPAKKASIRKKA